MTSAPKKGVSPGNQNEVRWASDKIDGTKFSNIPNPVSFLFKWKSCLHLQMGRISSSLSKDLLSFCISHTGRNHRTVSGKVNARPMMWKRRDNSPTQPHSNHRLRMKRQRLPTRAPYSSIRRMQGSILSSKQHVPAMHPCFVQCKAHHDPEHPTF